LPEWESLIPLSFFKKNSPVCVSRLPVDLLGRDAGETSMSTRSNPFVLSPYSGRRDGAVKPIQSHGFCGCSICPCLRLLAERKQKLVPEGYAITYGVSELSAVSDTEERVMGGYEGT